MCFCVAVDEGESSGAQLAGPVRESVDARNGNDSDDSFGDWGRDLPEWVKQKLRERGKVKVLIALQPNTRNEICVF